MIGGEMTDIECEGKTVDLEIVDYIHYHKTAALIEAALLVGAMLADASESDMEIIRSYGRSIGLAFQIVDDILDIVSTTEELGKDAGSDIEKGKATYPSIVGLEKSRERARELYEESIKALDGLKCDTSILRSIAERRKVASGLEALFCRGTEPPRHADPRDHHWSSGKARWSPGIEPWRC